MVINPEENTKNLLQNLEINISKTYVKVSIDRFLEYKSQR